MLEVWLNHVSAYVEDIIQILNNTPQLLWSKYSVHIGRRGTNELHLVTLVPCALLAYLGSPIHGIVPLPAAIITTIAPHSIGP